VFPSTGSRSRDSLLRIVKERDLDEFASVFRRAIIPTIEVERIRVESILLLLDGGPLTEACTLVAQRLAERFGASVSSHTVDTPDTPEQELAGVIEAEDPSLIIAPEPFSHVDALLIATPLPTLLIRKPDVESIFTRIVAKIPGGRHDLIEQFSIAFALCRAGGHVRLLHIMEEQRLAELARILELAPGIDTESGQAAMIAAAKTRMDHLLRGAVRTAKDAAFEVEADLRVGDPFAIVPEVARDASLLILGSQASHTEFLDSRAYALMKATPGVHVLAL